MSKNIAKKIFSLLLIVSIISPTIFLAIPQKTEAITVIDVKQFAIQVYSEGKKMLVKVILQQLTQQIVNWIDSGFDGNPAFIQNPSGFLTSVADQTIGEFIFNEEGLKFLCDPFKIQIQLALGLQYQPFKAKVNCTLSDILTNTENAYNDFVGGDFINGGGWDSWFSLTTNPANSPQGAFLIAKSELDARIVTSQENSDREVGWGQGSLSLQKCTETEYEVSKDGTKKEIGKNSFTGNPFYKEADYQTKNDDESSAGRGWAKVSSADDFTYKAKETKCAVTTPGQIIVEKFRFSDTSFIRTMELESVMGESINAIGSALVNQLTKQLMAQVQGMASGILGNKNDAPDYKKQVEEQLKLLEEQQNSQINSGGTNNGTNTTDNLSNTRNQAISAINNQLEIENNYIQVRSDAKTLLENTSDAYTNARICVNRLGGTEAVIRSTMFTDRINIIQGNMTGPVIGGQVVNIKTITEQNAVARSNKDQLNSRKDTIPSATSIQNINSAISGITSAPFHAQSDIKENLFTTKVEDWVKQEISSYASPDKPCSFTFDSLK